MADQWLTCDHFMGKVSAMGQPTRPTEPPSLWGRKMITAMETIKWQTRAAYGCLVACQSLWAQA